MKYFSGLALLLLALPATAQTPAASPSASSAVAPTPAPLATVELAGLKPDAALWAWTGGGPQGEPKAGSARLSVVKGAKELFLLDKTSGQLATISLSSLKNGKLDVSRAVFSAPKPGSVTVRTLSSAKKPVAGASVALVAESGASKSSFPSIRTT